MDIQAQLDQWLADNPAAQQYVLKLWYLHEGEPLPPGVTHTLSLSSVASLERRLGIGLVVKPEFALVLDGFLALVATQPPA
jgi:hypothetical protein